MLINDLNTRIDVKIVKNGPLSFYQLTEDLWYCQSGGHTIPSLSLPDKEFKELEKKGFLEQYQVTLDKPTAERTYKPVAISKSDISSSKKLLGYQLIGEGDEVEYLIVDDQESLKDSFVQPHSSIFVKHPFPAVAIVKHDCRNFRLCLDLLGYLLPNEARIGTFEKGAFKLKHYQLSNLKSAINRGYLKATDIDECGCLSKTAWMPLSLSVQSAYPFIFKRCGSEVFVQEIDHKFNKKQIDRLRPLFSPYCTLGDPDSLRMAALTTLYIYSTDEQVVYEIDPEKPECSELGINYPFVVFRSVYATSPLRADQIDVGAGYDRNVFVVLTKDAELLVETKTLKSLKKADKLIIKSPAIQRNVGCRQLDVLYCSEEHLKEHYIPAREAARRYYIADLDTVVYYKDLDANKRNLYIARKDLEGAVPKKDSKKLKQRFAYLPSDFSKHPYSEEDLDIYNSLRQEGYVEIQHPIQLQLGHYSVSSDRFRDECDIYKRVQQIRLVKQCISVGDVIRNKNHVRYRDDLILTIILFGREDAFVELVLPKLASTEMEAVRILSEWQTHTPNG